MVYKDQIDLELNPNSPLEVSEFYLNEQGLLTIEFNKILAVPSIYEDLEFKITCDEFEDHLEHWTQLNVHSEYYEEGDFEIGIKNHTLKDFRSNVIEIMVDFNRPELLS